MSAGPAWRTRAPRRAPARASDPSAGCCLARGRGVWLGARPRGERRSSTAVSSVPHRPRPPPAITRCAAARAPVPRGGPASHRALCTGPRRTAAAHTASPSRVGVFGAEVLEGGPAVPNGASGSRASRVRRSARVCWPGSRGRRRAEGHTWPYESPGVLRRGDDRADRFADPPARGRAVSPGLPTGGRRLCGRVSAVGALAGGTDGWVRRRSARDGCRRPTLP